MPVRFSLLGGSLRDLQTKDAWAASFSSWLENLKENGFYRHGVIGHVPNIWCFKWSEVESVYRLIQDFGFGRQFDLPGAYLWLRDEGGPSAYHPIYIGISFTSMKSRFQRRYIPSALHRSLESVKEPKQFEIVAWFGDDIRRNSAFWKGQREDLIMRVKRAWHGTDRVEKAERFARTTHQMPYFTFHPVPIEEGASPASYRSRLKSIEDALIILAEESDYELLNELKPSVEPDWESIG